MDKVTFNTHSTCARSMCQARNNFSARQKLSTSAFQNWPRGLSISVGYAATVPLGSGLSTSLACFKISFREAIRLLESSMANDYLILGGAGPKFEWEVDPGSSVRTAGGAFGFIPRPPRASL